MNELLEIIRDVRDCPWSDWAPATLKFCEAHVCAWIVAPAETWSNLAYLLVGFWLIFRGRSRVETRLGLYAIVVGICSSLFHASYTYAFETLDLASMFFLGFEILYQALGRLGWIRGKSPIPLFGLLLAGGVALLLSTRGADRLLVFTGLIALGVWFELLIFVRERRYRREGRTVPPIDYAPFGWSLGLFAVAFGFWVLDYQGILCVPDRHFFSGHAAWHVVNAGCFLTLSRFYRPR